MNTAANKPATEKFSVRGDVTEEFPFLVIKKSPYDEPLKSNQLREDVK